MNHRAFGIIVLLDVTATIIWLVCIIGLGLTTGMPETFEQAMAFATAAASNILYAQLCERRIVDALDRLGLRGSVCTTQGPAAGVGRNRLCVCARLCYYRTVLLPIPTCDHTQLDECAGRTGDSDRGRLDSPEPDPDLAESQPCSNSTNSPISCYPSRG